MAEDAAGAGHVEAPIIIKKRKAAAHGHHGGAWKVAYADMVTALMALFIVLWILAQSDEVVQNVAGYFRDPVGFKEGGVPSIMDGGHDAGEMAILPDSKPVEKSTPGEAEAQRWRDRAERILGALEKLPTFEKYRDQIEMALTPDGLRISLIESEQAQLFKVGSVALNPDGNGLLRAIGSEIQALPNHIAIEGHTDSRRFAAGSDMTNWELSTGRANTARRVLEDVGITVDRMFEVRGMADRQLYNPLDPEDSRNRRVSITLLSDESYDERRRIRETTILD